jgi:protoporphyrinogen/coproporphyrinogen III oxidase
MRESCMKHIVILGAGITGLSLAWYLKKRFQDNIKITILEKSPRPGGWIQTIEKKGFLFELGPHSCRPAGTGVATLRLVEDLQVQDQVISADPSAHLRYLLHDQKLSVLPNSLTSFMFSSVTRGVLKAMWREFWSPKGSGQDESIYAFITRRFNNEIAEKFFDPLTSGIYAGDIRKLSIKSSFPILYRWEQEHGSVMKGMIAANKNKPPSSPFIKQVQRGGLFSFKGGMETLTRTLGEKLQSHIVYLSEAKSMKIGTDHIEVHVSDKNVIKADFVCSTLPATAFADVIHSNNPKFSEKLKKFQRNSIAVVSLGYSQQNLKHRGFGYLIPSREKEEILGVIWDSSIFPQQNHHQEETRLTVMIGDGHHDQFQSLKERNFIEIALQAVAKHLQIHSSPDAINLSMAYQAIPQYYVGHSEQVLAMEQELSKLSPRLHCLGTSYYGVSINDCIAKSEEFANSHRFEKED